MIEILEFFFQDFWHFLGLLVLILVIGVSAALAFSELPRR